MLEAEGRRIYGYGSDFATRSSGFLVSDDGGAAGSGARCPSRWSPWPSTPRTPTG